MLTDANFHGGLLHDMNKIATAITCFVASSLVFADGYDAMLCYDFAGVEVAIAQGDPFNGMPKGGCDAQTVGQFLSNPDLTMSPESLMRYADVWLREFHYLAVFMEASAKVGDSLRFAEYANVLAGRLKQYDEHLSLFGEGVLRRNRLRLEYAISRIINDRSGSSILISANVVRTTIPPIAGEIAGRMPLWLKKQETFRNMLILGSELECYSKKHGTLPNSVHFLERISEADTKDAWGDDIVYLQNGVEWKLFSAGGHGRVDVSPESAVLPEIDRINGIFTSEVWFSSDFSDLRRSLMEGRTVNPGCAQYECILDGSCVRRR